MPSSNWVRCFVIAGALAGCVPFETTSAAITFNMTPTGNAQADAGFAAAAARWGAFFDDDITINITAQFSAMQPGVIGGTTVVDATYNYGTLLRPALTADASTADDFSSSAALQSGASVNLLINRTANSPHGQNSATPYLDNDGDLNNAVIRVTRANAKAIGLVGAHATGSDATISFNNSLAFDFNPNDGIDNDKLDFVGVATHELGHALGFISGIETLDTLSNSPFAPLLTDDQYNFVRTMDLFRFSPASLAQGAGIIDWTADTRSKFFSVNGGVTLLDPFSTGTTFGDGQQPSHWKDNLGIGLMDPTTDFGELMTISGADLRVLDVVGFDLLPEPATLPILAGLLALLRRRRAG